MERTVPSTDSNEIELYVRTYYSLLRSSSEISIEALVESHQAMGSLLHSRAAESTPDIPALIYTSLRLPLCIFSTDLILLGQRRSLFQRSGYPVEDWEEVAAPARRRRAYYDGDSTLALYIASRSDIDDIIPAVTAFQIEWNKLHNLLSFPQINTLLHEMLADHVLTEEERGVFAAALGVEFDNIDRLLRAWGDQAIPILQAIAKKPKRFSLRLLAGSIADYRKATRYWWLAIRKQTHDLEYEKSRVYFVSSNTHSLVNMWSGYGLSIRDEIATYLEGAGHADLLAEHRDIEANAVPSSQENFFYYAMKKYLQDADSNATERMTAAEHEAGIHRANNDLGFDLAAQVIEVNKANAQQIDPRLCLEDIDLLKQSNALIINIDYPLGLAAYEFLSRIAENTDEIVGVYIMGKAATLNGRIGDVMIPTVVHDEHSQNTYLLKNCFTAADVHPYLAYGTVLDNQKSVTVRGTFLQNPNYMGVFYREGFSDIEMEAGPYLSAIYELLRPKRHPQNEIISLHSMQTFDLGIIHYASDKPLSKGKNLGASSLSYRGMDPTYAASAAILRRIIQQEIRWVKEQN